MADDIDWSLCDEELKILFDEIAHETSLITNKDRDGLTVEAWKNDERSENFVYRKL